MDRQSILGYILIFILLVVWMWMSSPKQGQQAEQQKTVATQLAQQDSARRAAAAVVQPAASQAPTEKPVDPLGKFFSGRDKGQEQIITIESDLFIAEISTKGGVVKRWELKKYKTWDGKPVQLVDYKKNGDLSLLFATADGRLVNTHDLYFERGESGSLQRVITGNEEAEVKLVLPTSNGGRITKTLRFKNGEYGFNADIGFSRMGDVIANYEYQLVWESGLRYAEQNSIDESSFAAAYAYAGKELTEVDASSTESKPQKNMSGVVDWVAARTKYFAFAIVPKEGTSDGGYLEGSRATAPDKGALEAYSIAVKMPFKGGQEEGASFRIFFGPADISLLKSYGVGLDRIVGLGWTWLIRPISEYVMLPLLNALHYIAPNWGVVIILFSLIIKVVLHPLSRSSMRSMKKMQALQPLMNEIKEKYKDDPQKMNQQVMNLYKEYGVNPAGGCLPLLLQFPVMIALYNVLRATIELRQGNFVWWITDLSIPDRIFTLPFEIPFFAIQDVSGLALLMGVTMFIQQKMSVKDPRQKAMVWMMPVMMTLLFNSFPSGLNLYYFVFNVLSIGQQIMINRQSEDEPLRKVEPKKKKSGGIFGKLAKELPRLKR
ncbi:MAG: membrane protein insertase YidC [Ignavibacteriales bacterium]|nr:membrane protein insertase YidC [Ignavibacteriales bacterium]